MYPAFRVKDPYFDYGLSCYPCIQNNYIYCREGTQEMVSLSASASPPYEFCC
jgi:hypothetical protein